MKWLLRGLVVIVVVIVGYAVTANYVPKARVAAICVPAEVLAINLGLIPLDRADWGYLKLRSGKAGLNALRELEMHGATDKIRQISVAVQEQWFEAGHITYWGGDHLGGSNIQEKETRFNELRMPLDGKTMRQDLLSGQQIPERFWQTWRYHLPCLLPPKTYATGECVLHMANLTGSSQAEIIIDAQTISTWEEYIKPAVGHRLTIFQLKRGEWQSAVRMRLCQTELATVGNGQINFPAQALDMLRINGHAVNFFDSDCMVRENTIPAPVGELNQARAMAPLLTHIARLPLSKPLPESLAKALADRTIVLPWATEPPMRETWMKPAYHGLPPCFTSHNPKACLAMVSDINHDGSDDVVILDRNVRKDVSTWRLATLLMVRQGRWTVVASHAACAEEGQKPEDLKVEFKPSTWHPVEFAGRLYTPDEPSDNCNEHYLHM